MGCSGWFANIALFVNIVLLVACLSLLEATLTLPGIAGIVLTLGTALDANILINERIREEVKLGRSPINALETGYSKASGTILDSNLTNLIAMACLYAFGSGPVKGFAVTVAIGTIVQMWTATVLTRLLVVWWYRWRRPKELPVLERPGLTLLQRLARPLFRLVPDVTRIRFMRGAVAGPRRLRRALDGLADRRLLPRARQGHRLQGRHRHGGAHGAAGRPRAAPRRLAGQSFGDVGLQSFGDDRTLLVRLPAPGRRRRRSRW
jgi:multidrug efflux pump subunit AcrB